MADDAPRPTADIESRADCELLVRTFYGRTLTDPIIGWIFTDAARLDLDAHVPVITSFWETVLLGAKSYAGGPFPPHADLHAKVGLRAGHFGRWLALWTMTVDELFAGERAELAKSRAIRIAQSFHQRLQSLPGPEHTAGAEAGAGARAGAGSGGLVVTTHGPAAHDA